MNFIRKIIFRRKRGVVVGTNVHKYADDVLNEVKHANSILLHCHVSPDPDSVGSALAMKIVLERMGKKVTVIRGDSEIPRGYMHFPGVSDIVSKNIFEIDLKDFDLFISVDSASVDQITKKGPVTFPDSLKIINIDHHETNKYYGHINLVESKYPSCAQVLYEIFQEWRVDIDRDVAENLYVGIYTDSVEFRTSLVSAKTLQIASLLKNHIPDLGDLLFPIENNETRGHIKFIGLMVASVESYMNDKVALASVGFDLIKGNGLTREELHTHDISPIFRSVPEWQIIISMTEIEPNLVKVSTRSKDPVKYDVSKLADSLGGGGHKAAAGIVMKTSLVEAKKMILLKLKELYNF